MFSRSNLSAQTGKLYPLFSQWLSKVSKQEYWKFLMDSCAHEIGSQAFDEDEPGYMRAMQSGFKFVLESVPGKPHITVDFILELHRRATEGVHNLNTKYCDFRVGRQGYFEIYSVDDIWEPSNCSPAGANEINDEWIKFHGHISFYNYDMRKRIGRHDAIARLTRGEPVDLRFKKSSEQKLRQYMSIAISHYYHNIHQAETDFEKIYSIARFLHHLDLIHCFSDANIRTYIFLLGSLLLIQNGFFPIQYDNPNVFDAHSTYELTFIMMRGIKETAKLYGIDYHFDDFLKPFKLYKDPYEKPKAGPKILFHYENPFKGPTAFSNRAQIVPTLACGHKRRRIESPLHT